MVMLILVFVVRCPFFYRIERKIATISLESRDGPGRLGDSERGNEKVI